MSEIRKYLLKTIAALEDAHAYLCHAEQIVRDDERRLELLFTLGNNRQWIMQVHDACVGLLEASHDQSV